MLHRSTPSTLAKRYGSQEHLTHVVLETMAVRWLQALQPRWERCLRFRPDQTACGLTAFLPDVADLGRERPSSENRLDLDDLRSFLTFLDLAASDDATAGIVTWVHAEERQCLIESVVALTGTAPALHVVTVLHAAMDGLRHRVTDRNAPMPLEDAQAAWTLATRSLTRSVDHDQVA